MAQNETKGICQIVDKNDYGFKSSRDIPFLILWMLAFALVIGVGVATWGTSKYIEDLPEKDKHWVHMSSDKLSPEDPSLTDVDGWAWEFTTAKGIKQSLQKTDDDVVHNGVEAKSAKVDIERCEYAVDPNAPWYVFHRADCGIRSVFYVSTVQSKTE